MFTILTKSNKVWKRFRKSGTVFFLSMIILFTGFDEATSQNKPLLKDETLLSQVLWEQKVSEEKLMSINFTQVTLKKALEILAEQLNVGFSYNPKVMPNKLVSFEMSNAQAHEIIYKLLEGTNLEPMLSSSKDVIILRMKESIMEADVIQETVTGTVIDAQTGESLPGVNVIVAGSETATGSIIGTTTDMDGFYEIRVPDDLNTLIFSYVGYLRTEVQIDGQTEINVELTSDVELLDDIVVIGYGTMRHQDFTGSLTRADIEAFRTQPNTSIIQSLQGSVPGLNIGQVTQAGQEPSIEIRDRTSIAGSQNPLMVVDGVIYRGNLIDLNPADVESVNVLKDASAAAVYGSEAANGVILITTKKSGRSTKPTISFSSKYTIQSPVNEFSTVSGPSTNDEFIKQLEVGDLYNSRTPESGYLDRNPDWDPVALMRDTNEILAFNQGRFDNWYNLLTNDAMNIQDQHLSVASRTESSGFYLSLGYTDQQGYLVNEGYNRINARINANNHVTDWLEIGINSFVSRSDFDGPTVNNLNNRYFTPFATSRDEHGELIPLIAGTNTNPLYEIQGDLNDNRVNLNGTIYTNIEVPFIEGLSYRGNFSNNYRTRSLHSFEDYAQNFQGSGSKFENKQYQWSSDHVISYENLFKNLHRVDLTLLYGAEARESDFTEATASQFNSQVLGYHSLQMGNSEQQQVRSGGWDESSLYQMARLFYGYDDKYQVTATVRRDGFSGFSEENKFGIFPSIAVAWVVSEETFISENFDWLDRLKLRTSYGSVGNRTISRYQTLARVSGDFMYVDEGGSPLYSQSINSLASPNLKWETTTGFNFGLEFEIFSRRISTTVDYYTNKTTDLLYNVDLPDIARFSTFPDNLGRLDNYGIEVALTTLNIEKQNLRWESTFLYSRSRNELKELLGFDLTGDGKEDDLVSEGLFIGESIDAVYDYTIDGFWQVGDDIPPHSDLGAYRVVDMNGDGDINADDKSIIGYARPSYRFGINNKIQYKNWSLNFFINSIQGGRNHYKAVNDLADAGFSVVNSNVHFTRHLPNDLNYWSPENPNATYIRPGINASSGLRGTRYQQRNFIRLQDISLAYNLSGDMLNRLQIRNLRLFLSGKNLITLTDWNGWDPETGQGVTAQGRPVMKGFTMGADISF